MCWAAVMHAPLPTKRGPPNVQHAAFFIGVPWESVVLLVATERVGSGLNTLRTCPALAKM